MAVLSSLVQEVVEEEPSFNLVALVAVKVLQDVQVALVAAIKYSVAFDNPSFNYQALKTLQGQWLSKHHS